MAVTITPTPGGSNRAAWQVTFALDGDTTATIPHRMNGVPRNVTMAPRSAAAYTGAVFIATVDATNIVLTKNVAGGSAGAIVDVSAVLPNGDV